MKSPDSVKIRGMINNASNLELELIWLKKIANNQTDDEIEEYRTMIDNGIGANKPDSFFIAYTYKLIEKGYHLTDEQAVKLRKILPKYWRQYAREFQRKEENRI